MKEEYYQELISQFFPFPLKEEELRDLMKNITIKKIPARTILLSEGDIVTKVFLIVRECLRTCFIKDNGAEITSQFFTEGQMVMSFQSAVTGNPSRLYIDAIEDSVIGFASIKTFEKLISHNNAAKDHFAGFQFMPLQNLRYVVDSMKDPFADSMLSRILRRIVLGLCSIVVKNLYNQVVYLTGKKGPVEQICLIHKLKGSPYPLSLRWCIPRSSGNRLSPGSHTA